MLGIKSAILFLLLALVWYKYNQAPPKRLAPIVKTELGELQGSIALSRTGREYFEYLGIPYAKAPVGELRFEAPEEPIKWNGVRNAQQIGNECSQMQIIFGNKVGEEDCLFLNVFVPKKSKNSPDLLPTMVFIHGGHYMEGSGSDYGPEYFMDEDDVVLVTIKYRLAALGFLSTGDGIVAGNAGLKDQAMALAFVQRNIAQFGGDPKQVTIFGESAGGASVHLHMLSPKSQGSFQKAISQSGSALAPWTIQTRPKEQAEKFATRLGCPTSSKTEMLKCLKKVPVEDIIATHSDCRDTLKHPLSTFLPTVEIVKDGAFLPEDPSTLIKNAKSGVPWMTGINRHDGLVSVAFIARNRTLQSYITDPENWLKSIPIIMFSSDLKSEDVQKLRQYYFDGETSNFEKRFDNYTNLMSDILFNYKFVESVKYHSQHSPVFAYQYSYPGEFSLYNILLALKGEYHPMIELLGYTAKEWINKNILGIPRPNYGVSHADELALLFKMESMSDLKPQDKDFEMSQKLIKLWTSFAANGSPVKLNGISWEPIKPDSRNFEVFNIDENNGYIKNPFGERMEFLKQNIYKNY